MYGIFLFIGRLCVPLQTVSRLNDVVGGLAVAVAMDSDWQLLHPTQLMCGEFSIHRLSIRVLLLLDGM